MALVLLSLAKRKAKRIKNEINQQKPSETNLTPETFETKTKNKKKQTVPGHRKDSSFLQYYVVMEMTAEILSRYGSGIWFRLLSLQVMFSFFVLAKSFVSLVAFCIKDKPK